MKNKIVSFRIPLFGAVAGLLIISLFIFAEEHPKPEWGRFWWVRPVLVTPCLLALGSYLAYRLLERGRGNWRILTGLLAALLFVLSVWIGIVMGLDGTLWD